MPSAITLLGELLTNLLRLNLFPNALPGLLRAKGTLEFGSPRYFLPIGLINMCAGSFMFGLWIIIGLIFEDLLKFWSNYVNFLMWRTL